MGNVCCQDKEDKQSKINKKYDLIGSNMNLDKNKNIKS